LSQHDLDIANQTFPNTRSDLNDALQALGSTSSGATVPSTTYANQLWYDTANNKLYIRNEDNDANIEICELDQTNDSVEFFKSDSVRTALVEYTDGTDALTVGSGGELTTSSTLDVDGNELILDSDGDTSITSDTDDQIDFKTGGTDRMVIDSSGNVGIGTDASDNSIYGGILNLTDGSVGGETTLVIANNNANQFIRLGVNDSEAQIVYDNADELVFGEATDSTTSGITTERMRIASTGYVGIGTSNPARDLHISDSGTPAIRLQDTGGTNQYCEMLVSGSAVILQSRNDTSDGNIVFRGLGGGTATEHMRINSSGNVGIGTSSPSNTLHVKNTTSSGALIQYDGQSNGEFGLRIESNISGGNFEGDFANDGALLDLFANSSTTTGGDILVARTQASDPVFIVRGNGNVGIGTSSPSNALEITTNTTDQLRISDITGDGWEFRAGSNLIFKDDGTERMRITSAGHVGIGVAAAGNPLSVLGDAITPVAVNRTTNDGTLISFRQDGVQEGTITVSGTTVSLVGAHLSRWGRLADGSQPTILKGTVMSNLDEMIVWSYDDVLYTEEDELPEGKSVGDVKTPAYTAENEQRNQLKISDVEGDINVAGLFVKWDTEEDGYNDIDLAMTGDMVIRIAQGTTVQRGDLLMSAGDGTAKPQEDDIVRSKTIAKVTSTTVINTYDDGSYVVPCVVMAC